MRAHSGVGIDSSLSLDERVPHAFPVLRLTRRVCVLPPQCSNPVPVCDKRPIGATPVPSPSDKRPVGDWNGVGVAVRWAGEPPARRLPERQCAIRKHLLRQSLPTLVQVLQQIRLRARLRARVRSRLHAFFRLREFCDGFSSHFRLHFRAGRRRPYELAGVGVRDSVCATLNAVPLASVSVCVAQWAIAEPKSQSRKQLPAARSLSCRSASSVSTSASELYSLNMWAATSRLHFSGVSDVCALT